MDLTNKKYSKKGKPAIDIQNLVYGKIPPQATDLEQAVLGAIMLEKEAIDLASEILTENSFYRSENQLIFKAALELSTKGQAIDVLTIAEQLKKFGQLEMVGGPYYITQLTNAVVSAANIVRHSQIIKQKELAREMIKLSGETIVKAYDDTEDVFDLINNHEVRLSEITTGGTSKSYAAMDEALVRAINKLEELRNRSDIMTGVPSGFTDIDRLTNGWQNTDLIILAARPSVGKTALALNLMRNASINHFKPTPSLFFSLEMSESQLINRMLSAESEIALEKINNGRMDESDMKRLYSLAIQALAKANISIDDSGSLTLSQLRSKARKWARRMRKVGYKDLVIFIDYLQLMSGGGKSGNREQEISEISRGLKQLAKEIEVPIIALSQLSRQLEARTGDKKIPQLSDLRESGAIEQDADTVIFIYRPEYHDISANQMGESTSGETHIKFAKNRHGALDTIKLRAQLSIQKFFTWDGGFSPQPSQVQQYAFERAKNSYSNADEDLF